MESIATTTVGHSGVHHHKAAILHGAKDLRMSDQVTHPPKPDEVQVQIRATGLCGTDLHYYSEGRNGVFVIKQPLILGHEASGEIAAVGSNVELFKVGDKVVIEPQRPCLACATCLRGKYNVCPSLKFTGSASADPPVQGSLQEYYNHPAAFVHHLPGSCSFEEGALIEPLAVAVHAVRRSGLVSGQSVLVLGAGAIGLLCAAMAKAVGATNIVIVDVDQTRLDFATKSSSPRLTTSPPIAQGTGVADRGFKMPLSSQDDESKAAFAARIAKEIFTSERQPDTVFECTGNETCCNVAIHATAPGGKVVFVGMGAPIQNINIGAAAVREVDMLSVWRYANTFQPAIELLTTGRVDLKSLVTHRFDLDSAKEALESALKRPQGLIKCVVMSN